MEIEFKLNEAEMDIKENTGTKFGPGNYEFRVGDATLIQSSKGTPGLKLTLLVDHNDAEFKVFDDVWLTRDAAWKYARLMNCIDLDGTKSLDTEDLLSREGKIRLRKKKDSNYLEIAQYYTQEEQLVEEMGVFEVNAKPESVTYKNGDVPF